MLYRPCERLARHVVGLLVALVERGVAVVGEVGRIKKYTDGRLGCGGRLLQQGRRDGGLPGAIQDDDALKAFGERRKPRLPARAVEDVAGETRLERLTRPAVGGDKRARAGRLPCAYV